MTVRVVTPPTAEPLSLTDTKLHLRVDYAWDDALISTLIVTARQYAENYTRRVFAQRTLELDLPGFPYALNRVGGLYAIDQCIDIPYPPLQSVSFIKYIDLNGTLQTVAPTDYQVDTYREPGQVKPAYLQVWPVTTRPDFNVVQIQYVAGYAAMGSPAPDWLTDPELESLRQWMKVRIGTMYAYREGIITGTIVAELKRDYIDGLLDCYVVDLW